MVKGRGASENDTHTRSNKKEVEEMNVQFERGRGQTYWPTLQAM